MDHSITQNPFMPLSDQALKQTERMTCMQDSKGLPLTGMRLAVKDLFHIAGLPTSAGNPTWLATHETPSQTASSVQTLFDHGACFCGKTITDELAYSLNGQNIHYGTPCNPTNPDRLPGGSTSGSAVAVASDFADIGLGTDTGGSIRVPASYNGLFGLRPTHGVIAVDGLVPLAPSFDTVGWLAQDLDHLEATANALLASKHSETIQKILIADNLIQSVEHADQIQTQLDTWLNNSEKTESLEIDLDAWKASETFRTLQGAEILEQHGEWLAEHNPIIAPDIRMRFNWCKSISSDDQKHAAIQRDTFTRWIDSELKGAILIIPTTPGRSPLLSTPDDELADYRIHLMNLTAIAGLAGLPQLHLPVCNIDGAPCGLSLIGPKNSDLQLIQQAKVWLTKTTIEG
ncbi:amidase [Marinomonas mediterranea]|uniref:amidase n=1 Tax=Marinomonas mediterranea TaxID=119864 RepID=UPI002348F1E8|nr:amidase [Marinomonas mediterranea]WCN11656.1 amidase [Marinomonas mediterranea]